jgi:hypothetical protein
LRLNFGTSGSNFDSSFSRSNYMKPLFLIALSATLATAEPHPNWWAYTSPEATAVVGIQWNNLRNSPFAAAIEAEISPSGALGFPDLDCLRQAREIVISSPALLGAETGSFPAATVNDQAQRLGLHRLVYREVTLWLPEQADKLGLAQISEQLVLVGTRKTLETAIDRGLSQTSLQDSPLLSRAEFFSKTGDLWAAAVKLPDPLASRFVPLDGAVSEFLGQVSVHDGLVVQASFDAGSEEAASKFARELRERAPSFPPVARGLEAAADQSRVTIALQVNSEDLVAAWHSAPAAVIEIAVAPQGPAGPQPPEAPQLTAGSAQPPSPVTFEITHVEDSQPRIIHIFNLDEGTREIEITHVETSQPQIIRIFNPDESTRQIVLSPTP